MQVNSLYILEASINKLCILNGHHGLNEKASWGNVMNRMQINLLRQCLSKISNSEELNDEMWEPEGG